MGPRRRARPATIQLLSGFFFLLIFVVSATSMQDLGGLARQERERKANLPRRSRVYTNEDLARPRILDPEDRKAAESAPESAKVVPEEFPAPRPLVIDWPDDIPLAVVARFYEEQREAESAPESAQVVQQVVQEEFPAPRPLVIDWPDDIPLAVAARFYEEQVEPEAAPISASVAPVAPAPELPAPRSLVPRSLVIDWPDDIPLAVVARFYEEQPEAEAAPISASAAPVAPARRSLVPRSLVIDWPDDIPLGDVARFYRREREKEAAGTPEFAAIAPPTLDLEPWLFANPVASPLPATLDSFFPPREIAEPVWDAPQVSSETVRVERGDTLWEIAERHFGNGNQWTKIAEANPALKNPNRIQPGQQLLLPVQEVAPAGSQIRVRPGDSLWKLAAAQLGTGHAWACLAAANPQIEDANRIYPGQVLVIPAACSTGA